MDPHAPTALGCREPRSSQTHKRPDQLSLRLTSVMQTRFHGLLTLLLAIVLSGALVAPAASADPGCQSNGGLVIWARGSGQSFRDPIFNAFYVNVGDSLGAVAHRDVELGNEDGDFKLEAGEYPAVSVPSAAVWPARYFNSREIGANGLVNYLNRRAARCSQEAFILGGFSQGADVVGDAILRKGYGSLSSQARDQIGVVAQYGDPSHFTGRGILSARPRPEYLLRVNRVGSWCDVNDFICNYTDPWNFPWGQSHSFIYKDRYIPDTARWIADRTMSKISELRALPPAAGGQPPPPVAQAFREQQGQHGSDTFSDYHGASGKGQRVNPAQWIDVSCKVRDPSILSVWPDGYWYRIATAPWNDHLYAPANAFMNGDPWGGPFTHNTDFAVPDCWGGPPAGSPPSSPPPTSASPPTSPPPPTSTPPAEVTLTVYNRVTNGPSEMREDTPAYLSTVTQNYCKRDGCAIAGTDRNTGGSYTPAVCQAQGARTTNGNDGNTNDDQNPGLFSSTRWYGIRVGNGLGYISAVWIDPSQRGGLGLETC